MMERFRRLSITRQLSITAGLSIVVFSLTLTAVMSYLIARQLRASAIEDAQLQTEQFAERSLFAYLVDDPAVAANALQSITNFPEITAGALVRRNGEVLASNFSSSENASAAIVQDRFGLIADLDDAWIFSAAVESHPNVSPLAEASAPGERLGVVALEFSKERHRAAIRTIWAINGAAGIVAASLFLVLVAMQMRVLLNPLQTLSDAISEGKRLKAPKPAIVGGPREVREIAEAYNELIVVIEGAQAALECEVAIRTDELRIARDAALAASRQKSEIMSAVTHEMRTPLQAISGYAQLSLEDLEFIPGEGEHFRGKIYNILSSATELLTKINQMLDLARVEARKFDVRIEEFDARQVFDACIQSVAPIAADRGIALQNEFDVPQTIKTDKEKVHQIVVNLLTNACKFTEKGSVALSCVVRDSTLRVEVADTGAGIAKSDLEIIFEPFRQLDMGATRPYAGTGLGLALTREFVKLLGGTISVESELGKGSVFRVIIPLPT